jgi:glycosyltransferase involved in cell wall biosynthesis
MEEPSPQAMAEHPFPRTLVVIPALNESESIARVVRQVRQHAPWADICVINDGSRDATGRIAQEAGVTVLHLPFNVGIGAAVQTGFIYAERHGYEVVVRNDGDGQHGPEDIRNIVCALQEQGLDMVIGSRYLEDRGYVTSLPRRMGIVILARLISLIVGQRITDPTSGFSAFNRRTIELCANLYPHDYPEPEAVVMLHRAGLCFREIPVTMLPRQGGQSSITPLLSFYYMVKVILAILVGLLRPAPVVNGNP